MPTPDLTGALVLFPGALGDAVCLEPAIAALAASQPVTLHARGGAAEVAALYPSPVTVRSLDAPEIARLFSPEDDPRTTQWLDGFARIVSFTGIGVPDVVRRLQATGRAALAAFPRPPLSVHAVDLFLRAVGGDPRTARAVPRLELHAPSPVAGPTPLLVLLPGSGGRAKRAPAGIFESLARRWRQCGGDVSIVLGPAEPGEDAAWGAVGRTVRPSSVATLARDVASAAAFVGNDSGPSHVAAALGTPGVVLYTTTDPTAFGPRGSDVTSIVLTSDGGTGAVETAWQALRARLP
ncbi:glycosyltransferase family 9 protein [Candidatus Binatia bacterium]|nr:glycosyltransferase family 9 protein [Candidatus Binatia bacterium]